MYLNSLEDDVLVIDKEIADVETNLHDAKVSGIKYTLCKIYSLMLVFPRCSLLTKISYRLAPSR